MKLSKYFLPIMLVASTMTTLVGCGGGGGGASTDPIYAGWYNVYGAQCGNLGPGCNYYASGLKIIDVEDPNFDGSYFLENATWSYNDSYGDPKIHTGWAWLSPNDVLYDAFGNALNEKLSKGRDHVGDVIEDEEIVVARAGSAFSEKYGLSLETGMHVSRTLHDHAISGKDRARTQADVDSTSGTLYGVPAFKISFALEKAKQGDQSALEEASAQAASNWGTTPETFRRIQTDWFAKQVKQHESSL
ncbi:MAG: hypothetical protein SGJ18_08160 [Pseudomonadota bacterium]|nr:hypothetical protein [Pseudomonadota bacterium]